MNPRESFEQWPKRSIRYKCRNLDREIQFNFHEGKITCSGMGGQVGKGTALIEELYCLADNLGVASRALLEDFLQESLSREKKAADAAIAEAGKFWTGNMEGEEEKQFADKICRAYEAARAQETSGGEKP